MSKRIYLSSPHMGGTEQKYVNEAFETNWIAPLGPNVNEFEKVVANYVGVKDAAALTSGTAAIHLALKAIGVKQDDLVFCSSLTFAASCNPIIYEGAIPVFIDSEPDSYNMSPKALEKAFKYCEEINKMPKAVIIVNLYGQSADMYPLIELCKKYNVQIIEDAAESLGATYNGKKSGTFGDYGIFSFNGNKIITTSGGGMLVSNDEEAIKKVRFWSTQARENKPYYEHKELGFNYRMSNVVAGIGRGQMEVLEQRIKKKKEIFTLYKEAFKEILQLKMAKEMDYGQSNYWLSIMTVDEKSEVKPKDIIEVLENNNIEARHIWKPMHMQPYYKEYKFFNHNDENEESISQKVFRNGICLPSDTKMTIEEQKKVINLIKDLFN
ncbi:DegT/DnrJ/EryC1/StrS family aminotransferase [Clostridium mediterraneense]|uniref:DegT/DnrJ/EryC1/StrS family aminotransferase n=1 Tax=Clostridium mediterraneense TaxID=1805472 RepID=UPI0008363DD1|nr:aminotransferase class I/II-fold pyridoxal phosphate-dependent enzyme [Clostridium mediterraneense]